MENVILDYVYFERREEILKARNALKLKTLDNLKKRNKLFVVTESVPEKILVKTTKAINYIYYSTLHCKPINHLAGGLL